MALHADPEASLSVEKISAREILKLLKYFGLYGLFCVQNMFLDHLKISR